MKFRRTIIETTVYEEIVEADSSEEAFKKGLRVRTGIQMPGSSLVPVDKLVTKGAAVASVQEEPCPKP